MNPPSPTATVLDHRHATREVAMLRPQPIGPVPEETARIAHAAFPNGHPSLRLADELGALFTDETFAALFANSSTVAFLRRIPASSRCNRQPEGTRIHLRGGPFEMIELGYASVSKTQGRSSKLVLEKTSQSKGA
jgi:hypothetical protein